MSPTARRIASADLSPAWAAELGAQLDPGLSSNELRQLTERTVPLDHGLLLAHLRTARVEEPRLAALRVDGREDGGSQPWLLLAALLPERDAARHLGWMAHLAAGLHQPHHRLAIATAEDDAALTAALVAAVREPNPSASSALHRAVRPVAPSWRLVVAILKDADAVDHLLNRFVEEDVRGATILDGRGMAEHLAAHLSLFAGFKTAFAAVGHSQVVLTVVPAARVEEVLELVRQAAGLDRPGSGIAFTLDVGAAVGLDRPAAVAGDP